MGRQGMDVARAVIQRLESLERAGVAQITKPGSVPAEPIAPPAPSAQSAKKAAPPAVASVGRSLLDAVPVAGDSLEIIQQEVAACRACDELACTRTQTVFGVGNPHARLVFLGEAPGADEDRQGEPFVGRAGQLLTRIIEACTLKRSDVYILNVLKCRPPGNRNPLPPEVENCRGFLDRQLDLIKPEFICCLGSIAAQTLLGSTVPISRLRGKFVDYRGIRVMCTYHPAYLLRNPSAKKDVWEDMKVLMSAMGIELGKAG
jgi:uracil-DNA glycosylase